MVMLASEYVFVILKHCRLRRPDSKYEASYKSTAAGAWKTSEKKLYCIALTYNCAHLRLNYNKNKNKLFYKGPRD